MRVLEVPSDASLRDLHEAIQDAVDFDRDHLFEFFVGRDYRNRKLVFDEDSVGQQRWDAPGPVTLEKLYPLPKRCKLYYLFDFGDNWCFEIRKSRKKPHEPEPGMTYPRVVESIGPNPEQYGPREE